MDITSKTHSGQTKTFFSRLAAAGGEIFAPVTAPRKTIHRTLLLARQTIALLGVFGTAVQIVVWLMIGVLGGQLDVPWWLWTATASALLVGGLTLAHRLVPAAPRPDSAA